MLRFVDDVFDPEQAATIGSWKFQGFLDFLIFRPKKP